MAMTGKALELKELLEPTVTSLGLELLGVEFSPAAGNTLLRLYIDAPGRLVAIEDCEAVSREVSAIWTSTTRLPRRQLHPGSVFAGHRPALFTWRSSPVDR